MRHVLVVDDEPGVVGIVTLVLERGGYLVRSATNGEEALAAVEQDPPELVLLDMRMPVLDGVQFAERMHDLGLDVPIVVMTGTNTASLWADIVSAVGILEKPFGATALLDTVHRYCPAD